MAVTWRTATDIENSHVQWKKATPNPVNSETTLNLTPGIARTDTVEYQETTNIYKSFRTTLTNLDPGQTYMYRIGADETAWREWIHFNMRAGDPEDAFTFIYL